MFVNATHGVNGDTRKMKWLIRATLSALLLLSSAAHAADTLFLSQEEQDWLRAHPAPLRIHNETDWKPYNYNENGVPVGYSIDYMTLLSQKLNVDVQYVSGPSWSTFLEMMKDGSLDVMLNIANTRERRKYLRFTDPYHITNVALYVQSSRNDITDLDSLSGQRLGFIDGFFFAEFLRQYYPDINIVPYPSLQAAFVGVQKGEVDAAMDVPLVARHVLRDTPMNDIKFAGKVSDPVFITTFSIATHKDNATLSGILQKAVDSVTSQEIQAINEKWALKENHISQLSENDLSYLRQLGELKVCVHPDRLPLEAVNIDGSLTGISSEFVELLAQRIQVPFKIVPLSDQAQSVALAKQRTCDIVPMISKGAQARAHLNFTSPWLSLEQVVATRNNQVYISDLGQVNDQRFAIVRGHSTKTALLAAYPTINLVEVDTVSDGLLMVAQGDVFGFIDTLATISRALQTHDIDNVKISGALGIKANYAMGVRSDDGKLLNIMERAVRTISPTDINAIYNRWLAVAYVKQGDYTRFWQALLVLSLLTGYIYYRYRQGLQNSAVLKSAHAEIETANRKLDRLARTDPLTGLSNRLETDEILHQEFTRFQRYQTVFSIVMMDLDHFKKINDEHGHEVGDDVLIHIAGILTNHTRKSDTAGRWGGEEFLIICPSSTAEGVLILAKSLRLEIETNVSTGLTAQSASFGVATIRPGETIKDLMRRADDALYQAKGAGRNRVTVAS